MGCGASTLTNVVNFFGSNYDKADAQEEEQKLRESSPDLLNPNEHVKFAFSGRGNNKGDLAFLTDLRILIKDRQGLIVKRTQYRSTPYHSIDAWAICTAGGILDGDVELKIYAQQHFVLEFSKDIDLMAINRFMNTKVLDSAPLIINIPAGVQPGEQFQVEVPGKGMITLTCPDNLQSGMLMEVAAETVAEEVKEQLVEAAAEAASEYLLEGLSEGACDMLGEMGGAVLTDLFDDGSEVDPEKAQKKMAHILAIGEQVCLAFKTGRDYVLLTDQRFICIDASGIIMRKTEYFSMPWRSARGFELQTAGSFMDQDVEVIIHTCMSDRKTIEQDLRKDCCDIMRIQQFFADKILGIDNVPPSAAVQDTTVGQEDKGSNSLFSWLDNDSRQIDSEAADRMYHYEIPLLQRSEKVEMAFKGRVDVILMTNKRFLRIDHKGVIAKKTNYLSLPWSTFVLSAVETAGGMLDNDCELKLWTDIMHDGIPMPTEDVPNPLPLPGMSYLEIDFQKTKVDLMAVQRCVANRIISANESPAKVTMDIFDESADATAEKTFAKPGFISGLMDSFGGDSRPCDANMVAEELGHGEEGKKVLLDGERIGMAFKCGKDRFCLTNKRVLFCDTKGVMIKKTEYKSLPYSSIRAFEMSSAGPFDRDVEITFLTSNQFYCIWEGDSCKGQMYVTQELHSSADIASAQRLIAAMVFGSFDGSTVLPSEPDPVKGVNGFLHAWYWGASDFYQIDSEKVDAKLHSKPVLLQADERVELAFKLGWKMFIYTTKRIIMVSCHGLTGKKVSYRSIPLKYCTDYQICLGGSAFDKDVELRLFTKTPAEQSIELDFRKGRVDMMQMQALLNKKILSL